MKINNPDNVLYYASAALKIVNFCFSFFSSIGQSPAYLLLALSLPPYTKIKNGMGIIAEAINPKVLRAHSGVSPVNTKVS